MPKPTQPFWERKKLASKRLFQYKKYFQRFCESEKLKSNEIFNKKFLKKPLPEKVKILRWVIIQNKVLFKTVSELRNKYDPFVGDLKSETMPVNDITKYHTVIKQFDKFTSKLMEITTQEYFSVAKTSNIIRDGGFLTMWHVTAHALNNLGSFRAELEK